MSLVTSSAASPLSTVHVPRSTHSTVVPRPVVDPAALSCHVLRPKRAGHGDIAFLGEAYRCWSEVWRETFEELDDATSLPSDDFTRQDEILALFNDWECVSTVSLRSLDVANPIYREDSYFGVWRAEVIAEAAAHGPRVCIASSFTVAPAWRRARGARLRDLVGALAVERFLQSDDDVLIGTVRNDRGMNAMSYGLGFRPLAQKLVLHGVEVDLVAFYRGACVRPPLEPVAERLVEALLPRRVGS